MKLASYVADGKACFGVVAGDGVITMNQRLGGRYAGLREAIAGDAIPEIKKSAEGVKPDHALADIRRRLWTEGNLQISREEFDPAKISPASINTLIDMACYAA